MKILENLQKSAPSHHQQVDDVGGSHSLLFSAKAYDRYVGLNLIRIIDGAWRSIQPQLLLRQVGGVVFYSGYILKHVLKSSAVQWLVRRHIISKSVAQITEGL